MFIKRNCVWLIAATLIASNLSQAQAGGGGFLKEVEGGQKYVNDARQVEGTAKELNQDAEKLFKKKPADAAATEAADAKKMEVKSTEMKTTEAKTSDGTNIKSTETKTSNTTTSK